MNSNAFCVPLAFAHDVQAGKLSTVWLQDTPLILTRSQGRVVAYEDFCPHRGVPLSLGKLVDAQTIECPYHGWRFNLANGQNTLVPVKNASMPCALKPISLRETHDLVWFLPDVQAVLPSLHTEKPTLFKTGLIQAKMVNVAENFLEGSHTHFVHQGYIRRQTPKRQAISAKLQPKEDGFEMYYQPEPPKGLLTQFLPKRFRTLRPVASYHHPHLTTLAYYDTAGHCLARFEGLLKPEKAHTRFFARIFLDLGHLTPFVSRLAAHFFGKVIQQDQNILEVQTRNLRHFPKPTFVSDETDVVGQELYAWMHDPTKIKTAPFHFEVFW